MKYQIQASTHPAIVGAITAHAELAACAEIDTLAGHAARRVLDVLGVLTVNAVDARDRDCFLAVRQVLDITKRLQTRNRLSVLAKQVVSTARQDVSTMTQAVSTEKQRDTAVARAR